MSVNIISMVKDAVSQQVMNKIGSMLGLDQSKTSSAFETAAGSILGGLIGKSNQPGGMDQIFGAVQNQDTGILDKLGDLLGGGEATDNFQKQGGDVLDLVFGADNQKAQQAVGSSLGLGSGMIGKLMSMAAPILMSVIGNYVKGKALNAVGLGSLLGEQKKHLSGILPAGLSSNLGFGNLLGDATGAASNVASGVGNAASSVGGAASNAANAATGAAGDAVKAGGGLLGKILPLAIMAAVLFALWHFLVGPMVNGGANPVGDSVGDSVGAIGDAVGDGVGAVGGAIGDGVSAVGDGVGSVGGAVGDGMSGLGSGLSVPGFDVSGLDMSVLGDQKDALMGPIGEITEGFGALATGGEEAAVGLAGKIGGFGTALQGMGIGDMGAAQQTAVGGILSQFSGVVEGLMANVPGPLQGIIQPAVDSLMETIKGIGL